MYSKGKAQEAATSEAHAKASEQNAKSSETKALTSETNAKTSETKALTSEQNAKTSEANAATSAKQAAESAGVFQDFTGATATTDGNGGKVPKPLAGQQDKVLKANGTWGDNVTPNTLWEGMHSYPVNYVPSDVSNKGWNSLGVCSIYYTKNVLNNQPTQYGQLINIPANSNNESTQLWVQQAEGTLFSRGGNGSINVNDTPFRQYATTADVAEAEKVESQGANWIRYKSGLQLCWVQYVGRNSWWSFPVAFSSTPTVVFTCTTGEWAWVSGITTTGCSLKSDGSGNGFAVGRWK